MNSFELLTDKIRQVATELISLKNEKQMFLSELGLLRKESQQFHEMRRENSRLQREKEQIRGKLERLDKKLEKMLSTELAFSDLN